MIERISSRQNPAIRRFRELARRRDASGDALLDGGHLLEEALDSGVKVEIAAFAEPLAGSALAARANEARIRTIAVPAALLDAISPVRQPSGVVAIARLRTATLQDVLRREPALVIVLDGVQDPGNVGTIIRTAEACGATGIVTRGGSADPFGWKALRGAMGSAFRVPVAVGLEPDALRHALSARGVRAIATVPRGGTSLPDFDLRGPVAVLLGSEASGLSGELAHAAEARLSIPMKGSIESLNVAVAAALILYEAARQRGF